LARYVVIGGQVPLLNRTTGDVEMVPERRAFELVKTGDYEPQAPKDYIQEATRRANDNPVAASLLGGLRGVTFGLSDAAFRGVAGLVGGDEARQDVAAKLRGLSEENPVSTGLGEVAGFATGAVLPVGPGAALLRGARGAAAAVRGAGEAGLARRALGVAVGGAVEGAGYGAEGGISKVAMQPGEVTADQAFREIGIDTLKGAAIGAPFAAGAAGLSMVARFGSRSVSKLGKMAEMSAEREVLAAEQAALGKKLAGEGVNLGDAAAGVAMLPDKSLAAEVARYGKLTGQLTDLGQKAADLQLGSVEKLMAALGERKAQALVGGAAGGLVGGWGGAVAGAMVSPMLMKGVRKALVPVGKMAGRVAEGGQAIAATRTAQALAAGLRAVPAAALSSTDFLQATREIDAAEAGGHEPLLLAHPDISDEARRRITEYQAAQINFLQGRLDRIAPRRSAGRFRKGGDRIDPGLSGRTKAARYFKAVAQPLALLEDFAESKPISREGMEALEALHPGELASLRQQVADEVDLQVARGGIYSRSQEQQVALFLGLPSVAFGLPPLVPPGQTGEDQGGPGGGPGRSGKLRLKAPKVQLADRSKTRLDRFEESDTAPA